MTDTLGLWSKPDRQGGRWAGTCAADGDTWASLASMVVLDPSEAQKWVQNYDSAGPTPGKVYFVPNVFVGYSSSLKDNSMWPWNLREERLLNYLAGLVKGIMNNHEKAGFKVIDNLNANSADVWIKGWQEDGLYAMAWSGHTDTNVNGYMADNKDGSVNTNSVVKKYKIAYLGAFNCGSANQNWEKHVVLKVLGADGLLGTDTSKEWAEVFPSKGGGRSAKIPCYPNCWVINLGPYLGEHSGPWNFRWSGFGF